VEIYALQLVVDAILKIGTSTRASGLRLVAMPSHHEGFRGRASMTKGLANPHGAAIVAARADHPFASIDDLWRRADVPSAALVQLANAGG
jgi:Helix-hairpin-helix motif